MPFLIWTAGIFTQNGFQRSSSPIWFVCRQHFGIFILILATYIQASWSRWNNNQYREAEVKNRLAFLQANVCDVALFKRKNAGLHKSNYITCSWPTCVLHYRSDVIVIFHSFICVRTVVALLIAICLMSFKMILIIILNYYSNLRESAFLHFLKRIFWWRSVPMDSLLTSDLSGVKTELRTVWPGHAELTRSRSSFQKWNGATCYCNSGRRGEQQRNSRKRLFEG